MEDKKLEKQATQGNLIESLDLIDLIYFTQQKNRKFQAILLQNIEEVLDKNSPEFLKIRSLVLDNFNQYTRSLLRLIFGNDFDI
jgi:hypothetical protein